MSGLEVLEGARKLLERPEAWTQGAFARDAHGREVPRLAPTAVCWCAVGAIDRAANMAMGPERAWALTYLACAAGRASFAAVSTPDGAVDLWNDAKRRTHAQVLAAFDAAIEDARKAGR